MVISTLISKHPYIMQYSTGHFILQKEIMNSVVLCFLKKFELLLQMPEPLCKRVEIICLQLDPGN